MTIYVGNLAYSATEADLRELFAFYGTIKSVSIPTDQGRSKGFAFVDFETEEEEDSALKQIESLNGLELLGRQLRVNKAKPKEAGSRSFDRKPRGDSPYGSRSSSGSSSGGRYGSSSGSSSGGRYGSSSNGGGNRNGGFGGGSRSGGSSYSSGERKKRSYEE